MKSYDLLLKNNKYITILLLILIISSVLLISPSKDHYNTPKIIILIVFGLPLIFYLLINYKEVIKDKKDILLLIFLSLILLSTLFSGNIATSFIGSKNRYEGLLSFVIYGTIYLSSKYFFCDKKNKIINYLFYIVSFIVGILGILQNYIKLPQMYPILNRGVCGTFGNINFMGSFLSIVVPIAIVKYILKGRKN